jgi:hypothetical protein
MAYTHSKYEIQMTATAVSATASGDKASWVPGFVPHIVRACSVLPTVSGTTISGMVFNFQHVSMVSGSSGSNIAVINGTSDVTPGYSMYKVVTGEVVIKPGQRVDFNVGTALTAVNVHATLYVEPKWEQPGNATSMVAST